jgi:hypothetical protein
MIRAAHVATALYGAFRLALFDKEGLRYFEATVDGFWRSFFAAILVAPLYAVMMALRAAEIDAGTSGLILDGLAYVVNWLAFPVVMLSMVRVLDREGRYLGYIVAYNWAAVLQNAVYLPIAILILTGILPTEAGGFLSLLALGWVLLYSGYIAHVGLNITPLAAGGIVAVDLLLGVIINGLAMGGQ